MTKKTLTAAHEELDYWLATADQLSTDWHALNLSFVRQDQRSELLTQWSNTRRQVRCLCQMVAQLGPPPSPDSAIAQPPEEALALSVVLRQDASAHLRRTRTGGASHHLSCRHYSPSEDQTSSRGWTKDVLDHDEQGNLLVGLQFAINSGEEPPNQNAFDITSRTQGSRSPSSRSTLRGLLHLMWECASLAVHEPGIPRNADVVWTKLWKTASHMIPRSRKPDQPTLGAVMAVPCDPHDAAGTQARRNYARLAGAIDKSLRMLLAGIVDTRDMSIDLGSFNAKDMADFVRDQLRTQLRLTVNVWPETIDRALRQWPAAAAAIVHQQAMVLLFAVARVHVYGGRKMASVEQLVMMPLSDEWIPVDSSHELRMAHALAKAGRRFVKPLVYDSQDQVHPDFVLLDCEPACAVEVYGMKTPEYMTRKAEKIEHYKRNAKALASAYWDVLAEPIEMAMLRLPAQFAAVPSRPE